MPQCGYHVWAVPKAIKFISVEPEMDLSYVKKLIKLVSDSDVDEVEIEEEGKKIRVVKSKPAQVQPMTYAIQQPMQMPAPSAAPPPVSVPLPSPTQAAPSNLHEIRSPIVGTFYKSPAPDAAPFVEVGASIQPGTVLCIVEAMKLMNEIESDINGKIAKVMVDNGQPVEYDQVLFLVEKA